MFCCWWRVYCRHRCWGRCYTLHSAHNKQTVKSICCGRGVMRFHQSIYVRKQVFSQRDPKMSATDSKSKSVAVAHVISFSIRLMNPSGAALIKYFTKFSRGELSNLCLVTSFMDGECDVVYRRYSKTTY